MTDRETIRKLSYACKRCASCRDWSWYDPRLHGFIEGTTKAGYTICPTYKHSSGFESDFPRGKVKLAMGLAESALEASEGLVRKLFECTNCGNCTAHCPQTRQGKLDPLEAILATRSFVLKQGSKAPGDLGAHIGKPLRPQPISPRWIDESVRRSSPVGTLGFFPGCASPSVVSRLFPEIARGFLATLAASGTEYQTLDEGWCCGYLHYSAGDRETVLSLIQRNLATVHERGVQTLVTTCAGCFQMFSAVYPRLSEEWRTSGLKVMHSSQLLANLLESGALKITTTRERPIRVSYHDPCDLGRKGGVFEEPRAVLRRIPGVELVEMEQRRENAFCCGAGSGLKVVNPDMALDIAKDRVRQAEAAGAELLVSCCPACLWNLSQAAKSLGSVVKVMDLCTLTDRARRGD